MAHRILEEDKTVELLVKWKNYSSKQNTWEPLDDFYKDVGSLVDRYFKKQGLKVQGKSLLYFLMLFSRRVAQKKASIACCSKTRLKH